MTRALLLAAPTSGSGKTAICLGLLRALRKRGVAAVGAKSGPDFIDPMFHALASGAPCVNLDAFAMPPQRCAALIAGNEMVLIEGAMGLFDGAGRAGRGSAAELARGLGVPVILVIDAGRMAHSVAALVRGFAFAPNGPQVAGLILNRVGSPRHEAMLRAALTAQGLPPVLGAVPRSAQMTLPERHLGLVPAAEVPEVEDRLEQITSIVSQGVDLDELCAKAHPVDQGVHQAPLQRQAPPAQRIAVARDDAFAFAYPHLLADWRAQGAEISFFSPLADQAPEPADLIFLPGGYPELHAGDLASRTHFKQSLHAAAQTTDIYGECGGYMTLGDGLVDGEGKRHVMLGLLRLETSFQARRLHLGYRHAKVHAGPFEGRWIGHEFHYASTLCAKGEPLMRAWDADGADLGQLGLRAGRVCGSFVHLIDKDHRHISHIPLSGTDL